jgi:hypothetical protein
MIAICEEFEVYGYRRVGAALRQAVYLMEYETLEDLTADFCRLHGGPQLFRCELGG